MKLLSLKPGHFGATESGVPKTGDIAVLMTDVYGRSVVHKSGVPAVGEYVYLGTDENGKPVAIRKGGVPPDPIVDYIWSDATGQFIYFYYHHPFLEPFNTSSEITTNSYQTSRSSSRKWIHLYLDIRMHPIDEPLPDKMTKSSEIENFLGPWYGPSNYYEFNRAFPSEYYSYWDHSFWGSNYGIAFYDITIVTTMYSVQSSLISSNIGPCLGCFGALTAGKQPSAYANTRLSASWTLSYPKMYTNDPIDEEAYPNGQMKENETVTEMLHKDPERKSQSTILLSDCLSVVPIQRIAFCGDGIERHDQWGTVWAHGWWTGRPAIAYLAAEKTIGNSSDKDIKYEGFLEYPHSSHFASISCDGSGYYAGYGGTLMTSNKNLVALKPFTFTASATPDLETFPERGIIMVSTIGDLLVNNRSCGNGRPPLWNLGVDDATNHQFGIYDGKTSNSLNNVSITSLPENCSAYGFDDFFGTLDKYARVELTHTIRSGPHRITKFTVKQYVGHVNIYNIKISGSPGEMEMPPYGFFLYVGKHTKGPYAGKIYEMAMYYYQKNGDHLDCRSVEVLDMLNKARSSYPYFYSSPCDTTYFLDMEFHGSYHGIPDYFYPPFEVEVPADNGRQGYIYIVDDILCNIGMRFYHDDRFSGVQMNFFEPITLEDTPELRVIYIIIVTVRRVVSTDTTTYIMYRDGFPAAYGENKLYAVSLPSQFYTDDQYDAGRFPMVYGDKITPPDDLKIKDISALGNYCVMYVYTSDQQVSPTYIPPYLATYGVGGIGLVCPLTGPNVDPKNYYSVRTVRNLDSTTYTAPSNQDVTFLLIPELVYINERRTNHIITATRIYSLYRFTSEFKVYRYTFNQDGFIPADNFDFYPVLQMVCYDTNEVEEGEEVSEDDEDPGITHMILRYKHPDQSISCIRQMSIPHSSFERIW